MKTRKKDFVYLVYAPEPVYWSAGIKVLYKLHESIEKTGRKSLVINHGKMDKVKKSLLEREVQLLNQNSDKYKFVAIYPESIPGNPLNIELNIRWILNTPGLLGGSDSFQDATMWFYSENLRTHYMNEQNQSGYVVFIPALDSKDIEIINNLKSKKKTSNYDLLYAQKFRTLGGNPVVKSDNLVEITRFNKNSTSRFETLELVSNAKALHAFENSTIITEAQLLGTPVYCHQNFGFEYLIAEKELGSEGTTWIQTESPITNPESVAKNLQIADAKVLEVIEMALTNFETRYSDLDDQSIINFNPSFTHLVHKLSRLKGVATQAGFSSALRFIINYLKRSFRRKS